MRFWTVQSISVLETLQTEGMYQPDFSKSRYLEMNPSLTGIYDFLLDSFFRVNGFGLPGLIFAFAKCDGQNIAPFDDINDFYRYIGARKNAIASLWKHFPQKSMVLELDLPIKFNPLWVDINDFQFLMPPVITAPPYTPDSEQRILEDISTGQPTLSEFPSGIMQGHLPCIKKNCLVAAYPFYYFE